MMTQAEMKNQRDAEQWLEEQKPVLQGINDRFFRSEQLVAAFIAGAQSANTVAYMEVCNERDAAIRRAEQLAEGQAMLQRRMQGMRDQAMKLDELLDEVESRVTMIIEGDKT